jgi:predicted nuclease with TOPRIM domain
MQTKNADIKLKEAMKLYNEDKLPSLQIDEAKADKMLKTQFLYLKKAMTLPYTTEIRVPRLLTLKMRYRHVRAKINDCITEAKELRDKKCYNCDDIELERSQEDTEKLQSLKKEIKYQWILKEKWMSIYTKTATYARLRKLRAMWQERNKDIRLKEDYVKNRKLTQMPRTNEVFNID